MTQALLPGVDVSTFGDDLDFYETPAWVTELILSRIPLGRERGRGKADDYWHVLEPAAGRGAIIKAAVPYLDCALLTAVELHRPRFEELDAELRADRGLAMESRAICTDFLSLSREDIRRNDKGLPLLVILNPPYSKPRKTIGLEFVERSIELAQPDGYVAALLPLGFASGQERCRRIHSRYPSFLDVLAERPDFGGEYDGGSRDYAWFTWDLQQPRSGWSVLSRESGNAITSEG